MRESGFRWGQGGARGGARIPAAPGGAPAGPASIKGANNLVSSRKGLI